PCGVLPCAEAPLLDPLLGVSRGIVVAEDLSSALHNSAAYAAEGRGGVTLQGADDELAGFVAAERKRDTSKWFRPPKVPAGFVAMHRFAAPLPGDEPAAASASTRQAEEHAPPPAPAVPPPERAALQKTIDVLAGFVAKNGPHFEGLARQRQKEDPKFAFLFGGEGHSYYRWKLHSMRTAAAGLKSPEQRGAPLGCRLSLPPPREGGPGAGARMDAEARGKLLQEEPLPDVSSQKTRTVPPPPPAPTAPAAPPGMADKDRDHLRAAFLNKFSSSSGTEAAPERAAGLQQGGLKAPAADPASQFVALAAARFAPASSTEGHTDAPPQGGLRAGKGSEAAAEKASQKARERTHEDWWPTPLLCKRFGVKDPHGGRPPPAPAQTKFASEMFQLPTTVAMQEAAKPKFLPQVAASAVSQAEVAIVPLALPAPPPVSAAPAPETARLQEVPPPPALPSAAPIAVPAPPGGKAGPAEAAPTHRGEVEDAKTLASDFLDLLGGSMLEEERADRGGAAAPSAEEEAATAATFLERPIDLFKAIFEDEDEDEDENEGESEDEGDEQETAEKRASSGLAAPLPVPAAKMDAAAAAAAAGRAGGARDWAGGVVVPGDGQLRAGSVVVVRERSPGGIKAKKRKKEKEKESKKIHKEKKKHKRKEVDASSALPLTRWPLAVLSHRCQTRRAVSMPSDSLRRFYAVRLAAPFQCRDTSAPVSMPSNFASAVSMPSHYAVRCNAIRLRGARCNAFRLAAPVSMPSDSSRNFNAVDFASARFNAVQTCAPVSMPSDTSLFQYRRARA
ncbi:hypothetical protein CYMTET_32133, partial [Cymbomonas tetramitiformis]